MVILRYGTGLSFFSGRSQCFTCGKILHFWELFPLFSFLVLQGKCSNCHAKISWQYPLVELVTGILFYVLAWEAYHSFSLFTAPLYFIIFPILIVITVYDIRHKIIPDGLVWTFNGLTLLLALWNVYFYRGGYDFIVQYDQLIAGPLFFLPFFLLWFFSNGRLIGLGDGKLAIGMGFLLGIAGGLSAFAIAFWVGAIVTLAFLGLAKLSEKRRISFLFLQGLHLTMKSEVPFAPFLIGATILVFFYPLDIFSLHALGF